MNIEKTAKAIKDFLVDLAINDKLPLDMTNLSLIDLKIAIEKSLPTDQEKAIELASHYLSDGDLTTEEMVKAIYNHPNEDDLIDNVEGVVVWQKVEYSFTCDEFLKEIGYE